METKIHGYKAFDEGLVNRYGKKFEIGELYTSNGNVSFGNNSKYGFHFCTNMEDTFRFFDAIEGKVDICSVIGSGDVVTYDDEYYGYYDMFSVSKLFIEKKLSRDEIIMEALDMTSNRLKRFVSGFKLTYDEMNLLFKKDKSVLPFIEYYQLGKKDAFEKKLI